MRMLCTLALLVALASPAGAIVFHDESVDGDLSSDPANPTPMPILDASLTILGTTGSSEGVVDRDYITFTLVPGQILAHVYLNAISPDNLAFASFNAGATSFVPGAGTSASFLSGIHVSGAEVGEDLMPHFVSNSVTASSLIVPQLDFGTYCFLIQQTSAISQSYSLTFEILIGNPAQRNTWGAIKSLYR